MKDIKSFILESNEQLEDMTTDMRSWWDYHCTEDGYDSKSEFKKDMKAMAKKKNDPLVDDAFSYLESKGWKQNEIEHYKDSLIDTLAEWANDELSFF